MARYDSLRELIRDLEHPEELSEPGRVLNEKQAAYVLREMANALREIAWLPDKTKMAADSLKTAKYKAMIALKHANAVAEDFSRAKIEETAQ